MENIRTYSWYTKFLLSAKIIVSRKRVTFNYGFFYIYHGAIFVSTIHCVKCCRLTRVDPTDQQTYSEETLIGSCNSARIRYYVPCKRSHECIAAHVHNCASIRTSTYVCLCAFCLVKGRARKLPIVSDGPKGRRNWFN